MAYGRGLIGGMASIGRASQAPAYPISEEEQMRRMQANHMQPSASQPAPSTPARPGLIGSSMPRSAMLQPQQQPAKKNGILEMLGYDREATGMDPLKWVFSSREQVDKAREGVSDKQAYQDNLQRAVEAGLKGRDLMSYMANPEEWAKSEATNNEAANVGGGDSRYVNGAYQTAPVLGHQNGYAFTQTPNGVTMGDRFKPSYSDENAKTTADTGRMNAIETARNNGVTAAETALNHRRTEAQNRQYTLGPGHARFDGLTQLADNPKPDPANNLNLTPMQTATDKNWANELVPWASGGAADTLKQINQLDSVIGKLEAGKELTGPGTGFPLGRGIWGRAGIDAQETVEDVVQRNIKIVLGSQFTEKEGAQLIKRAYNPNLEEKVNLTRLRRLKEQMRIAAKQKDAAMEYYNTKGTMVGYNGAMPTMADFEKALEGDQGVTPAPMPQTAPQQAPMPSGGQQWGAPTPQRNNNGPMGSYRAPQAPQAGQPDPMDAHIDSLFADEGDGGGDGGGDGETFVNPQTGEEIRWNPQSGSWEAAN